jgi:PilZ domain
VSTSLSKENPSGKDRRRAPRYPFVADAEIVEIGTGARIFVRVTEISLYGCYIEAPNPLPVGSRVYVMIFRQADFFESEAIVAYSRPNLGMGLALRGVAPHFLPTLRKWLLEAMQATLIAQR